MRLNQLVLAILTTTACATDVTDELAGEVGDGEGGKADASGAFTYWQIAVTGEGYQLSRPNRSTTICEDGTRAQPSCGVQSLDLMETALPGSVAAGYLDRVRGGESILLRGELGPERLALAYARQAAAAGPAIAAADLVPALPASAPSIHVGDEAGPDCLYARLFVQDLDVAGAEIAMTPEPDGSLGFHGRFDGLAITASSEYAVACVQGAGPATIQATALVADGTLTVADDGTLAFSAMTYRFEGLTSTAAGTPSVVIDMLLGNPAAVGGIVTPAVGAVLEALGPASTDGRALVATEVWLPGAPDAGELEGVFVFAVADGSALAERRVNSTRSATIATLDFAPSGASDEAIARATADAANGTGVVLVGDRVTRHGKKARTANQFWTKVP